MPKTSEIDFKFPVLGFTPNKDMWGFPDKNSLTSVGRATLKEDLQRDMELVDADGRRWIVRSLHRTGRAESLPKWLLAHLISQPQSRIEHDLEALEPLTLADVQSLAIRYVDAFPFYCFGTDDPPESEVETLKSQIRSARQIGDMLDLLGLDSFMAY